MIVSDHDWHDIPDADWDDINAKAQTSLERWQDDYSRGRRWNRDGELQQRVLGLTGEWLYGRLIGRPLELHDDYDGGQDFDSVDVKATGYWRDPRLLRMATDPLKAPFFALVAVNLAGWQARLAGYATRQMLASAPLVEYGYGPTRTLTQADLLTGDELLTIILSGKEATCPR